MKEPPTPRPPNSRKYQKYQYHVDDPEPQISAPDPKKLVGTDHPTPRPLSHQHSGAHQSTTRTCPPTDAILRNTTPTQTNYAARTNLAPPTPTNEEGPATFATSTDIRARSREDLCPPPANRMAKKTKAPNRWTPVKDSKVRPPIPTRRTSPLQTKENPYTPGQKFQESNAIQHPETPQNSTGQLPPPSPDPGSPPCNALPRPDKPQD
ncbi:hypothetical protein E4T56_gene1168 [Termitomyces sp. T112]|nr:hypothetical protein E4T56_gene1168 [Termitomyces sp. T112]